MQEILWWLGFGLLGGGAATMLALQLFPRLGWLDFPERYGLKRPRLPYPGGVGLALLILAGLAYWPVFRPLVGPLLILVLVSWYDDRRQLSARFRLLVHIWLAMYLVMMGVQIYWLSNPFADTNFALATTYPWLAATLSVAWIVAIQNAMNWFDGLPGLNVGISGVGFLTLGLLGVVRPELWFDPGHMPLTIMNFFLFGLCAGAFWWYWQGRLILGDAGSQMLGWLLAVMAIFSGAKIATTLLVLSLPLLDMAWVIFRRIVFEKKSPFKGDLFHLHHLLASRVSVSRVTLALVGGSGLLGLAAVLLPADAKLPGFLLTATFILGLNWYLWRGRTPL